MPPHIGIMRKRTHLIQTATNRTKLSLKYQRIDRCHRQNGSGAWGNCRCNWRRVRCRFWRWFRFRCWLWCRLWIRCRFRRWFRIRIGGWFRLRLWRQRPSPFTVSDQIILAICILGLEFIHSNPRLLVGQKAASGWIFLFFTTLRESNIGWILRRALSRVNPTLHLLPASTMSECAAHTRPCLVLLEYHCQPCGLLWSTTSLHG